MPLWLKLALKHALEPFSAGLLGLGAFGPGRPFDIWPQGVENGFTDEPAWPVFMREMTEFIAPDRAPAPAERGPPIGAARRRPVR